MRLLVKELRDLAPATAGFAIFETAAFLGFERIERVNSQADMSGLWILSAYIVASFLGALHFGTESQHGTRGFLLSLPVSRLALMTAKAQAALIHWMALVILGAAWLAVLPDLKPLAWAEIPGWALPLLLLSWAVGARLSLWTDSPVQTLTIGFFLWTAGGISWSVLEDAGVLISPVAAAVGFSLLAAAVVVDLARAWQRLEARPTEPFARLALRPPWSGKRWTGSLLALEIRRQGIFWAFLAWPILAVAVLGFESGWFLAMLAMPLTGAFLGVELWSGGERDGVGFFLHHQPIHRGRLILLRIATALAAGAIQLIQVLVLLTDSDLHGTVVEAAAAAGMGFLLALALGALISPWITSTILGVTLALITTLCLRIFPQVYHHGEMERLPIEILFLVVITALAWWSTVLSRALEPGPWKTLKAIGLLAPFWFLFFLGLGF